jgi:hypothetical protein
MALRMVYYYQAFANSYKEEFFDFVINKISPAND